MDVSDESLGAQGGDSPTDETDLQVRLRDLIENDIPTSLEPELRLLLAILRQSYLDYFGDDPWEKISAALYFAHQPLYRLTLEMLNLPENLLPLGVDLSDFKRKERMNNKYGSGPLQLETLVRELSGTQLKIILIMGLVKLPATTRTISLRCGLTRSTVLTMLNQMADQELVERDGDLRPVWSLSAALRKVVKAVWDSAA
jgi:hypothetical protein